MRPMTKELAFSSDKRVVQDVTKICRRVLGFYVESRAESLHLI